MYVEDSIKAYAFLSDPGEVMISINDIEFVEKLNAIIREEAAHVIKKSSSDALKYLVLADRLDRAIENAKEAVNAANEKVVEIDE